MQNFAVLDVLILGRWKHPVDADRDLGYSTGTQSSCR